MIVLALYVCMILKAGQKKVARGYTGFDLSLFLPKTMGLNAGSLVGWCPLEKGATEYKISPT